MDAGDDLDDSRELPRSVHALAAAPPPAKNWELCVKFLPSGRQMLCFHILNLFVRY